MILTLIFTVFFGLWNFVLALLPEGHIDSNVTTAIGWFFQYAHGLDGLLPVSTIIQVLIWGVEIEVIMLFIKMLMYLLNYVRGR